MPQLQPNPSSDQTVTDTPERTPSAPVGGKVPKSEKEPEISLELQGALLDLVKMGEREADFARRGHYREMLEAEEFWKGNQYPIWSEKDMAFRTPWDYAMAQNRLEDLPTYQYVINIYQAYGLTVIAALSQKVPKVRFFPHSAKSEADIATARAASDIAELVEKNNRIGAMARREAYLLWTQGGFGTFTRFVRDKRKGIEKIPIVEMADTQVAPDRYICSQCGAETAADQIVPIMGADAETGTFETPGICPECTAPYQKTDFAPAETANVPVISGYNEVPEGYEKMSIYGLLNLKMQPYVQSFEQTGYLQLVEDTPEGALRAAYPHLQNEIGTSESSSFSGTGGTSSESDVFEKLGRMRLFDASAPYGGLRNAPMTQYLTYKRVWLRNWYLYQHPTPEIRQQLVAAFPSGCYVAFAGNKFLEARDEDIDDYWTLCTAMPSYGIYPQAIGSTTIPLNKQINDAANIVAEHLDYGTAPPVFYDAEFVSGDALRGQKMRPASFMPIVRTRGGQQRSIKELMYQQEIKIDSNIYSYGKSLIELVQIVSGALPSLFGGQMKGNETAGAYRQSRDQAMGKMMLFWNAVKEHHAETMRLAVECFRRNRTGDAERVMLGKSNDFAAKYIRLADLGGNITAEPEADEDFPQTWAEIRENMQSLMNSSPELAAAILTEPANVTVLKKYMGSPAITLSSEGNREKQFIEIDELLQAAPIEVPDPTQPIGLDGTVPTTFEPTVFPDVHADDHITHIKSIQEWAVDQEGGIIAKRENPDGYANVMAHLISHKKAIVEQQAFEQNLMLLSGVAPPEQTEPPKGGSQPPKSGA